MRQIVAENAPWLPADWGAADCRAVQNLASGEATPDQQRRALDWIIRAAARTYDLSYRPGDAAGDRDTAFAEGARSVGLQIVKLLHVDVAKLRERKPKVKGGGDG